MTASRSNVVRYARSILVQIGELPQCHDKLIQNIPKECSKAAQSTQTTSSSTTSTTTEQSRWSIRSLGGPGDEQQSSDRWRNRDDSRGYSNNQSNHRRHMLETETDATPAWFDDTSASESTAFAFDSRPDWVEQAERELETARMKWKAEEEPSQRASELKLKQINQSINHSIKHAEDGALNVDEAEAERVRLALEALNQANNQSLDDIQADFDDIDARLAAKAKADAAAATPAAFDAVERVASYPAVSSSPTNMLRQSSPAPPPGFSVPLNQRPVAQDSQLILDAPSAKRVMDPFMNDGIFGTFGARPAQSKPEVQLNAFDPWASKQSASQAPSNNTIIRPSADGAKSLWDLPAQISQPSSLSSMSQSNNFMPSYSQSRQPNSMIPGAHQQINQMHNIASSSTPSVSTSVNTQQGGNVQPWASQPDAVAYRIAPQDFFRAFAEQQPSASPSNDESHAHMSQSNNPMHMQYSASMNSSPPGFQQMMSQPMHQQSYHQSNAAPESDDPISKLVSRSRARKAGAMPSTPSYQMGGYNAQPMQQYPAMSTMNNPPINQSISQPKPQTESSFNPFAGMSQSSYGYASTGPSFNMMNKQSNDQLPHGYHQSMPQQQQQHSQAQQQYSQLLNHSMNQSHQQSQSRQMPQPLAQQPMSHHQAPQFTQPFSSPSPPLPAFFQNQAHQQQRY